MTSFFRNTRGAMPTVAECSGYGVRERDDVAIIDEGIDPVSVLPHRTRTGLGP